MTAGSRSTGISSVAVPGREPVRQRPVAGQHAPRARAAAVVEHRVGATRRREARCSARRAPRTAAARRRAPAACVSRATSWASSQSAGRARRPRRRGGRASARASSRSRAGERSCSMSTSALSVGRPEVAVDEARDVLVEPEAEQEVVAAIGVGLRDLARAADGRDAAVRRGSVTAASGPAAGARRSPWSRCASASRRASARRSARVGSAGRPGSIGQPGRSGAAVDGAAAGRLAGPMPPVSPTNGIPWRSTASRLIRSAAVFWVGDLADVGRLLVGASSAGRGRCPSACRPSATRGGSGPCSPSRDSRSSDSCSQIWSAPSDGWATSRSPSAMSCRVRGDELVAGHGRPRRRRADHRLAVGAGAQRPRPRACPSPIGAPSNAVTGRMPATLERQERLVGARRGRRASAAPSTGAARRAPPSPSSHDRVVPGRIAQSSDGVASSSAPSRAEPDEEDVGARRLRQVVVDGQEQRVVGAGPARLEPRVDVLGAGRRLQRGQRVLRVAPDGRRDEVEAALQVAGGRRRRPARPGSTTWPATPRRAAARRAPGTARATR